LKMPVMVSVFHDFGFDSLGLTKEDFLKENYVTQIGYPPLRIDILNAISGVNFDDAYKGRILGENGDFLISFINISDFIANKQATGRAKDIGDIEALQKSKKT
ncbi:MAG: nucleotidyltransferase family protein, partial [Mucilaginibacter sp.]|nr:nucleotidyltransferase family protein [Mucilaginibacter sp.]